MVSQSNLSRWDVLSAEGDGEVVQQPVRQAQITPIRSTGAKGFQGQGTLPSGNRAVSRRQQALRDEHEITKEAMSAIHIQGALRSLILSDLTKIAIACDAEALLTAADVVAQAPTDGLARDILRRARQYLDISLQCSVEGHQRTAQALTDMSARDPTPPSMPDVPQTRGRKRLPAMARLTGWLDE